MSRRRVTISALDEHPNLPEILGVLSQLAHIADTSLPLLAAAWHNSQPLAQARDRALSPDSPLVLEALSAFDALDALFADDIRGEAAYLTVPAEVTATALKVVRDAIAASYAQPALTRDQHAALMGGWRAVYPAATVDEPDLGPCSDQVKELLGLMPLLSTRCHDSDGLRLYDALVDRTYAGESDRADAREAAFQAAVLTSRRRLWALVRRSGAEGLSRRCPSCPAPPTDDRDCERVMALCLDAACALIVADALPDEMMRLLTDPVTSLIPEQRGRSS